MGNCLKTQLKSNVQNENLTKLGQIILEGPVSWGISAQAGAEVTLEPKEGTASYNNSPITTNVQISSSDRSIIIDDNSSILVNNYYKLTQSPLACEHTAYIETPIKIWLYTGRVSAIKLKNTVNELHIEEGVIEDTLFVPMLSNLENLSRLYTSKLTHVATTMSELGLINSSHLTYWELPFNTTLITGSVEDFVHVQRNRGYTTGDINCPNFNLPNVTFNGSTFGWTNSHIVWDASTITFNGQTINA